MEASGPKNVQPIIPFGLNAMIQCPTSAYQHVFPYLRHARANITRHQAFQEM